MNIKHFGTMTKSSNEKATNQVGQSDFKNLLPFFTIRNLYNFPVPSISRQKQYFEEFNYQNAHC